jgi:L-iditol 2-dehydrogenase
MGHELSGTIAAVGAGVDYALGLRVVLEPEIPCGKCISCMSGHSNRCPNMLQVGAIGYDGAFGEYVLAPASGVIPLPEHVELKDAAMIEPVAFAVHAARRPSGLRDANVLVLGAGTIGNLVAQMTKLYGAKRVAITDVIDSKLATAARVGIDATFNSARGDLANWLTEQFGKGGPDITFDCVALPATVSQAVKLTRRGGQVFLVGVPIGNFPVPLVDLLLGETSLAGVYSYVPDDWREAVRMVSEGKVQTKPLLSKTFDLEQTAEAFAYAADRSNEAIKVSIRVA